MNRSIALIAAVFSAFLQVAVLAGLEAAALPSAAAAPVGTVLHTDTVL
jgi:hypothetical protein